MAAGIRRQKVLAIAHDVGRKRRLHNVLASIVKWKSALFYGVGTEARIRHIRHARHLRRALKAGGKWRQLTEGGGQTFRVSCSRVDCSTAQLRILASPELAVNSISALS
jgi:hypothetical protein